MRIWNTHRSSAPGEGPTSCNAPVLGPYFPAGIEALPGDPRDPCRPATEIGEFADGCSLTGAMISADAARGDHVAGHADLGRACRRIHSAERAAARVGKSPSVQHAQVDGDRRPRGSDRSPGKCRSGNSSRCSEALGASLTAHGRGLSRAGRSAQASAPPAVVPSPRGSARFVQRRQALGRGYEWVVRRTGPLLPGLLSHPAADATGLRAYRFWLGREP